MYTLIVTRGRVSGVAVCARNLCSALHHLTPMMVTMSTHTRARAATATLVSMLRAIDSCWLTDIPFVQFCRSFYQSAAEYRR